jgi:hypothetical protein
MINGQNQSFSKTQTDQDLRSNAERLIAKPDYSISLRAWRLGG